MNDISHNRKYKGYNGTLILTDAGVIIERGAKGYLLGGGMLRGDKTIPYNSIVAIQLKKAGLMAGYIQLTLKGGSEAKNGLQESLTDENSIHFHFFGGKNKLFAEAKKLILEKINVGNSPAKNSGLDDLEKLAALKEKGIISEEEFQVKKNQLLGLQKRLSRDIDLKQKDL